MARKNSGNDTKNSIIQAANRVVYTNGAAQFTLDRVAEEAQVSKGGLLYHFPNKEALVKAMMTSLIERFDEGLSAALAANEDELAVGRWIRAYAQTTFMLEQEQLDISAALIIVVATDMSLLAPLQEKFVEWQARAEDDDVDPALATLLRLAVDGLWFADLLKFAPPIGEKRTQTLDALLTLLE